MARVLVPTRERHVGPDELEALIREARARQRRRRVTSAVVLAAAAGAVLAATAVGGGGHGAPGAPTWLPAVNGRAFGSHGDLAFVSRRRLYVLDGTARELVRVTARGASAPAFSPSGRWLSYSYRGRAGLARADGTQPHVLGVKGSGSWLPGGRLLLGRGIFRVAPSGLPARVGTAPTGLVAWAPDGSRYVFETTRIVHDENGAFHGVERLQVADSLTGPRKTWYRLPQRFTPSSGYRTPGIGRIVVLPKREGILFWLDPLHSQSMAADGLPVYELTGPGAEPVKLGTTVGADVSIARSGRFALPGGFDRIAWMTKTALTCRSERCTPVRRPGKPLTLEPALAPDGRTLAFVTAAQERTTMGLVEPILKRWYATRRLWVGRHLVPDSTGAAAPVWSSDGRSLLFVRDDALWLLPRLGGRPVRVAAPLFGAGVWPNYDGKVGWSAQFAWRS